MNIEKTLFPSVEKLTQLLHEAQLDIVHRIVPVDAIIQEKGYFDYNSLRSETFRNGDSHFSLLTHDELQQVLDKINNLESQGKIRQYIKTRNQLRLQFGQVTFFIIKKMEQQ